MREISAKTTFFLSNEVVQYQTRVEIPKLGNKYWQCEKPHSSYDTENVDNYRKPASRRLCQTRALSV